MPFYTQRSKPNSLVDMLEHRQIIGPCVLCLELEILLDRFLSSRLYPLDFILILQWFVAELGIKFPIQKLCELLGDFL